LSRRVCPERSQTERSRSSYSSSFARRSASNRVSLCGAALVYSSISTLIVQSEGPHNLSAGITSRHPSQRSHRPSPTMPGRSFQAASILLTRRCPLQVRQGNSLRDHGLRRQLYVSGLKLETRKLTQRQPRAPAHRYHWRSPSHTSYSCVPRGIIEMYSAASDRQSECFIFRLIVDTNTSARARPAAKSPGSPPSPGCPYVREPSPCVTKQGGGFVPANPASSDTTLVGLFESFLRACSSCYFRSARRQIDPQSPCTLSPPSLHNGHPPAAPIEDGGHAIAPARPRTASARGSGF